MNFCSVYTHMARQQHGFDFEALVFAQPGFVAARPGAIFDGYHEGTPVSVKTRVSTNDLCLGDYFRQASVKDRFILVVGSYTLLGNRRVNWDVSMFEIPAGGWSRLLHYSQAAAMAEEMKLITNLKVDDERWLLFLAEHAKRFNSEHTGDPFAFCLAGKRDHKAQKRMQCRISTRGYRAMAAAYGMTLEPAAAAIAALANRPPCAPAALCPAKARPVGLERFYTGPQAVERVVRFASEVLQRARRPLDSFEVVVEPSAGGGAFLGALRGAAPRASLLAFDLAPGAPGIAAADFLADAAVAAAVGGRPAVVVGNPPYGANSSLAVRFLNRCAELRSVEAVAFVLPLAFEKPSVQSRVRGLVLAASCRLSGGECVFEDRESALSAAPHAGAATKGAPKRVPSCVQVWIPAGSPVLAALSLAPPSPRKEAQPAKGWSFVKWAGGRPPAFHLQIIRAGGGAGKAFAPGERPPAVANYFVALSDPGGAAHVQRALNECRAELAADFLATTAVRSLAKPPLIAVLNRIVAEQAPGGAPQNQESRGLLVGTDASQQPCSYKAIADVPGAPPEAVPGAPPEAVAGASPEASAGAPPEASAGSS